MTRELSLAQVAAVSGATEVQINNWLARGQLNATQYASSSMGKARRFSRDNVLEVCMMARLVQGGMTPAAAAARIAKLFGELERKKPFGWFVYFHETGHVMCVDDLPRLDTLRAKGVAITVVNVTELRGQVDKAFEAKEK
jgi:hypothetical protein